MHRFVPFLVMGLGSLSPLPVTAQDPLGIRRLDGSVLDAQAADFIARELLGRERVTGAQIAVVNDGRLAWSAAYGLRQKGPDLPVTRETTMWTASITKAVFATWVMQLVEQGRLSLDAPVASLLPKRLDEYEPYAEKARLLVRDRDWPRVTVRMLLSHSSGLGNFASFEPDGLMRFRDPPGRGYRYSGEGLNLLQFVLEQRLGAPVDALMDSALFAPLGMHRTALAWRARFEGDVADRFGAEGQFLSKSRRNARAAGSMTASAEDLARFAIALMDGALLGAGARDEMLRPQLRITTHHQFPLPTDRGESEEAKRVGLAYGLGWGLLTTTPFGPAFFKEGHGDGAQTYMACFPRRRDCMVILTNSDNGELAFRELLERIMGITVVPWEWEGYTRSYILASRRNP